MKEKEHYRLDEAVKYFYDSEPLKKDLAAAVVNRVLAKKEKSFSDFEKGAYFLLFLIIAGATAYYFTFLIKLSFSQILMMLMVAGGLVWVSMKEFSILSKRLLEIH